MRFNATAQALEQPLVLSRFLRTTRRTSRGGSTLADGFYLDPKVLSCFFSLSMMYLKPVMDNCVDFVSLVVVISNVGDVSNNNFTHTLLEAELDEAVDDCANGMSEPPLPLQI